MMLSQLLWISSWPGVYSRDDCLRWLEDTWLQWARNVERCMRDEEKVDCFFMQRKNKNWFKTDVEGNRWRDRRERKCRVDLWHSLEFRELLVQVECGCGVLRQPSVCVEVCVFVSVRVFT